MRAEGETTVDKRNMIKMIISTLIVFALTVLLGVRSDNPCIYPDGITMNEDVERRTPAGDEGR